MTDVVSLQIAICKDCGDGAMVMPFATSEQRDEWVDRHAASTDHRVWRWVQYNPRSGNSSLVIEHVATFDPDSTPADIRPWTPADQLLGQRVFQRSVVVVEDWTELVAEPADGPDPLVDVSDEILTDLPRVPAVSVGLVAFLLARYDEIEQQNHDRPEPQSWCDLANGVHFDHAYVTADVASKRRLIELAFQHAAKIDGEWGCAHTSVEIRAGQCEDSHPDRMIELQLMASPFAGHPEYRKEWTP